MNAPIRTQVTYRAARFRITFHRGAHPGNEVVLHSLGEVAVAIALGLAGAPAPRRLPPAHAAELVMRGIARHGARHVRELAYRDRETNLAMLAGRAIPAQLRDQQQLWGGHGRDDRCTALADWLIKAAEDNCSTPPGPVARRGRTRVPAGVTR
jgi:hypothetical protein